MATERVTRTAPGWEERTLILTPPADHAGDGTGAAHALRPGFQRLAVLLEVTAFGGGSGLSVYLQHSPDGVRWLDAAAFNLVTGAETQVLWLEAQPAVTGAAYAATADPVGPGMPHPGFLFRRLRVRWSTGGGTHTFGVDVVAIYPA